MAESTVVKVIGDGKIEISSLADANTYEVSIENGDLTLNIPGRTVNVFLDRNRFGSTPSLRYGADQPISGSFTGHLRDISDGVSESLTQFLLGPSGAVASWPTALGANQEVAVWRILWTVEGVAHGDGAHHTVLLGYCAISGSIGEGDPGTVNITFTDYEVYPTVS